MIKIKKKKKRRTEKEEFGVDRSGVRCGTGPLRCQLCTKYLCVRLGPHEPMECSEFLAYDMFVPASKEGSCGNILLPLSLSTGSSCSPLLFENLMGLTLEATVVNRWPKGYT